MATNFPSRYHLGTACNVKISLNPKLIYFCVNYSHHIQIAQWDQNLEKFHLELYRLRCYMASLQGSELPNPKVLLACVSKPSKHALARLGIFSVSSFHAIVSSRNPMGLQGRFSKKSKKQKGLVSTVMGWGFCKCFKSVLLQICWLGTKKKEKSWLALFDQPTNLKISLIFLNISKNMYVGLYKSCKIVTGSKLQLPLSVKYEQFWDFSIKKQIK